MAHALLFCCDGLPLLYMGDELGLQNDRGYLADPARAADSRWLHRPPMDWEAAARRAQPGSVEARLFSGLRHLVQTRARSPELGGKTPLRLGPVAHPSVLEIVRGPMRALFNVSETGLTIAFARGRFRDRLSGAALTSEGDLYVPPFARLWLVQEGAAV